MVSVFKNLKKKDVTFICLVALLVFFQVFLELKMPDFTQKLAQLVAEGDPDMPAVGYNGGMMILCAVGSMGAAMVCGFLGANVAANLAKTLRLRLFDKITGFGDAEINRFTVPSLITRTTNDVVQIQTLTAMGLMIIIKAPVTAIWAIAKISSTSMEWTMATVVTVCIMGGLILILIALCYPRFKRLQTLTDNLNDIARENISGVRVVRAFNAEDYQEVKFEQVNKDVMKTQLFAMRAMGLMLPVLQLCMSGLTLAIYWLGAYVIEDTPLMGKAVQMGNMTAFTQYALMVVMSFMMLVVIFILLPRALVSARRISEVLSTQSSIVYKDNEVSTQLKGTLEFKNVSFAYKDSSEPCIKDISFKIDRGETFAIIGATGSGKSTLVNLIPRFYDATAGQILLDGCDLKDYTEEQLEKKISIAPQQAILFSGDIKSNVTYGCKEAISDDDPRIEKALRVANADFVFELEKGIHSRVAQGGTNFSGGQKQRFSIARAVFKEAEIVIFDDTFSALDYKTDMMVRKAIKENMKDTTVIIIAQRIGTIKNADRIIVLDGGRIVGSGKHDELLENCAVYKEIALSQLSQEEL